MTTADGTVLGTTKIVDHGAPADRFNLVLVAEGYQQTELSQFASDAQDFVNALFSTPPLDEIQCSLNVFRVDVASTDSGADDPLACGGSGANPATYFDSSFCTNMLRRLMSVNTTTVLNVVNVEVPQWHQILVVVNSSILGGAGGSIGITTTTPDWEEVAIHEIGHSAFGLADEYEFWQGCGIDTDRDNYIGGEPAEPNVTIDTNRATIKWGDLILATTALPTTVNADCTLCDPQPSPVPAGTVGAFEGACYYHCGCYRPEFDCMMRNFDPFCAVCRRRIRQTLSPYLADCYAPVFDGASGLVCLFRTILYAVALVLLLILAWIPGVPCLIQGVIFRIQNCGEGNQDPCIEL